MSQIDRLVNKSLIVTMFLLSWVSTIPGVVMWQWLAIAEFQGGFLDASFYAELVSASPLLFGVIVAKKKHSLGAGLLIANCTGFVLLAIYSVIFLH
jgi:hypothetical protein